MSDKEPEDASSSSFGDTVTVVNRTKGTRLGATWDGAHYHFKPGPTHGVPKTVAIAAYMQNPLNGSEDPLGDAEAFTSLIGIKGAPSPYGDCSPQEQSTSGERLNRKAIVGDGATAKQRNAGGANRADARIGAERSDLSADALTRTD